MFKKQFNLYFIIIIQLYNLTCANARWATLQDAPAELEFYNSQIFIHGNGKSEEIIEKQVKILNENGREMFAAERLHFNENVQKIEVIEAKTVFEGKTYSVPKNSIEVKPLASEVKGFDQLFQVLVSYTHVSPGSRLYIRYRVTTFKQPLPNYYAAQLYWGEGAYWKKSDIQLKSRLPLHLTVSDPGKNLEIRTSQEKNLQVINITLKNPVCNVLANESSASQVPDSARTWVGVSTLDTFEKISRALSINYEKVLKQALPPLQMSIRQAAKDIKDIPDQINRVTALLSEKIRYMGDWRTISGQYSPRSLREVADTQVGDCKDFSASTAAILNSLGYKARVAIVMRGESYLVPENLVPGLMNFNHAIVKVTCGNGKVYWIDPTNFTSMAGNIYPDIASRPAMVLDPDQPGWELIPGIDPRRSKVVLEKTVELKNEDIVRTQGRLHLRGEQAQVLAGAALAQSSETIKESIIRYLSGEIVPLGSKIDLPDLTSRIVRDIEFSFSYEQENTLLQTNHGPGIVLNSDWAQPFIDTSYNQEGTVFIGSPFSINRKIIILNSKIKDPSLLHYNIDTPWLKAERKVSNLREGTEIQEKIVFLTRFLTASEVKSDEFRAMKKIIKKNATHTAIIISQESAGNPLLKSWNNMIGWIKLKLFN